MTKAERTLIFFKGSVLFGAYNIIQEKNISQDLTYDKPVLNSTGMNELKKEGTFLSNTNLSNTTQIGRELSGGRSIMEWSVKSK